MSTRSLSIAVLAVVLASSAGAAEGPGPGPDAKAEAKETPPPSSHEKAARKLYHILVGIDRLDLGADAILSRVREDPEEAPFEDVYLAWYRKVFTPEVIEAEMAKIYMKAFTEKELKELAKFYSTELGQKTYEIMPEVLRAGAQMGLRRGAAHGAELKTMVFNARVERIKKERGMKADASPGLAPDPVRTPDPRPGGTPASAATPGSAGKPGRTPSPSASGTPGATPSATPIPR